MDLFCLFLLILQKPQLQALFVVPAESKEKHHKVVTVVKKGFSLNGRTIRPSQVGVSKHQ